MKKADQNGISLPNLMRGYKLLSRTLTNSGLVLLITPVFKFLFLSGAVKAASGPGTDAKTVCGSGRYTVVSIRFLFSQPPVQR
jgi:hypothetical protein